MSPPCACCAQVRLVTRKSFNDDPESDSMSDSDDDAEVRTCMRACGTCGHGTILKACASCVCAQGGMELSELATLVALLVQWEEIAVAMQGPTKVQILLDASMVAR